MHTNHIITGWDTALPGSWITAPSNEESLALDQHHLQRLSADHGRRRGITRVDGKNEPARRFGRGDGLVYDSWRSAEWYERHSGSGSPTTGPGVHSSTSSPEERLDLETTVCPRGRSHSSCYWPGTASDWMSSMSLALVFPFESECFLFFSAFINPSPTSLLLFTAQIWLWPRRVLHQVHIIRRGRWRSVWDRWVFRRDQDSEEAGPWRKGLLRPSSSGNQQVDQRTGGAAIRVHHQGAGHQRQHPPVPERTLRLQHPWDVSCWYVYALWYDWT